jgi:hypothetical protein
MGGECERKVVKPGTGPLCGGDLLGQEAEKKGRDGISVLVS